MTAFWKTNQSGTKMSYQESVEWIGGMKCWNDLNITTV